MTSPITATPDDAKKRLDVVLTQKFTGLTRSQIKKKILAGEILLNGAVTTVHRAVKAGDVIKLVTIRPVPAKKRVAAFPAKLKPKIKHEDDDVIVLDKPSGLLVHPSPRHESPTLAQWLVSYAPQAAAVGDDPLRPGIVHRLDRDVSGVMVVAKNQASFTRLKKQFQARQVKKEYLALVYGVPEMPHRIIELPIGRNREGKFVSHPTHGADKYHTLDREAKTEYTLIDQARDYALLSVTIHTGRTHQIRAHLSAIGHPIVGDLEYGPTKPFFKKFSKRIKIKDPGRIFLHSHVLGFYDPGQAWHEYRSPLPQPLKTFFYDLKK